MRGRMNWKVPGAISSLGCAFLSTGTKTVWGVVATPLRRTRVNHFISSSLFNTDHVHISFRSLRRLLCRTHRDDKFISIEGRCLPAETHNSMGMVCDLTDCLTIIPMIAATCAGCRFTLLLGLISSVSLNCTTKSIWFASYTMLRVICGKVFYSKSYILGGGNCMEEIFQYLSESYRSLTLLGHAFHMLTISQINLSQILPKSKTRFLFLRRNHNLIWAEFNLICNLQNTSTLKQNEWLSISSSIVSN